MKSKYHLNTSKVLVQSTDGSVFILNLFSKNAKIKLNIDPKSSSFWKEDVNILLNQNYKTSFLKKFLFSKK